jgi:hypothetical protein
VSAAVDGAACWAAAGEARAVRGSASRTKRMILVLTRIKLLISNASTA